MLLLYVIGPECLPNMQATSETNTPRRSDSLGHDDKGHFHMPATSFPKDAYDFQDWELLNAHSRPGSPRYDWKVGLGSKLEISANTMPITSLGLQQAIKQRALGRSTG
jgi:hypothetical protein